MCHFAGQQSKKPCNNKGGEIQAMTDSENKKQHLKYISINTLFNHSTGKRQGHTKSKHTYIQYRYIHVVSPLD